MTQSRETLISLDATPYYHLISRCVRRAFLCGEDPVSKQNFDHRRAWLEERLELLNQVFAIDLCAYSIMSNHFHLVVYVDETEAKSWTTNEVIERWCKIYKGPQLIQKYNAGEALTPSQLTAVADIAETWRERLIDISWYMRNINEYIARKANQEDQCTGRFWESRFKSQALLDEKAILSCMMYVDLNPIRARMAKTPEQSKYTSVKVRAEKAKKSQVPNRVNQQPKKLLPFIGSSNTLIKGIEFQLTDYLELLDWTGRQIKENKKGAIHDKLPCILKRLGIEQNNWITLTTKFEYKFRYFAGDEDSFKTAKQTMGRMRMPGIMAGKLLFGASEII